MNSDFWRNRKVFITGHTGFKGGWMALWLIKNGAKVYGYSLAPPTSPNFFLATKLEKKLSKSFIGDICNLKNLSSKIKLVQPSIIVHMAAQSIVGVSYDEPVNTFKTNIIGTVNILYADVISSEQALLLEYGSNPPNLSVSLKGLFGVTTS